jgi:hypothetical protein
LPKLQTALQQSVPAPQLTFVALAGGAAGLVSAPFLVADVVYAVDGRWLPPGWAVPQIVLGRGRERLRGGRRDVEGGAHVRLRISLVRGDRNDRLGRRADSARCGELVLYEPAPAKKAADGPRDAYLRWVPDIVVTKDRSAIVALSGVF